MISKTSSFPDSNSTPVTVIGLGLMGRALADAYLRAGHPTTVWNRTAAKAQPLIESGAKLAASVSDAFRASPIVITCLSSSDAVRELIDQVDGPMSGKVIVNLSSGSSQAATDIAAWAERNGAEFLDGAIMAAPDDIGSTETTIIYSGPQSILEAHAATLGRLAGNAVHLGDDHRLAALLEAAGVGLMWGTLNGFLHGAALIGAAGIEAATLAPLAAAELRTVAGWLEGYAQQIDDKDYPPLDATLDIHRSAMDTLLRESESLGIDLELPRLVKAVADRAAAEGHGDHSYAALIDQFRRPHSS